MEDSTKKDNSRICKICGFNHLNIYKHTAKCKNCGVLMYYPYVDDSSLEIKNDQESIDFYRKKWANWYKRAAKLNHINFTNMLLFTIDDPEDTFLRQLNILDYGGGGGQFAFTCKSLLPRSQVFITDINDYALIEEYRKLNDQIKWNDFTNDGTKFDYIFLNDVFEHVNDPYQVLQILSLKLKNNGKIFIDTPKQFWIYPFLYFFNKALYTKLLKGTVTIAHLQIWTKKSISHVIQKAGLEIEKYETLSEFTMKPDCYLNNMGITNKFLLKAGNLFYEWARHLGIRNKIMCCLVKKD